MSGDDLSFAYFPDNHRWSHGMLLPLGGAPWDGGAIGEVHRVGLRLRDRVGDDRAWFAEWTRMADGVAAYRLRAAHYYHAVWKERLERLARGETLSLSVPWEHLFLLVHG